MPTARRMLSGVAMPLFIARRIQVGLAANISPSITNRMAKPMRKSANAKDLIGLEPPRVIVFLKPTRDEAIVSLRPCQLNTRKARFGELALRLGSRRRRGGPGRGRRLGRLAG